MRKEGTRKANPAANPDLSNERHMSNPLVSGIGIGMNYVLRAARARKPKERDAMVWLTRYALLLDLTQDALSATLGMDRVAIREALTNPEGDISEFVAAVRVLRDNFESALDTPGRAGLNHEHNPFHPRSPWHEACCLPANTLVFRKVKSAFRFACAEVTMAEVQGKERLGKTHNFRHQFLRVMDRAAFFEAPRGRTEMDWLRAIATGVGVSIGTSLKAHQIRAKIDSVLGPGKIEVLAIDECHRLMPRDLRRCPDWLEDLRDYRDRLGVSVVMSTTPQFVQMIEAMLELTDKEQSFWRPGQHIGRRQAYDIPELLDNRDLANIAAWHCPGLEEGMVKLLIEWANADPGYIGTLVNIIKRAIQQSDSGVPSMVDLQDAKDWVTREARLAALREAKAKEKENPLRLPKCKPAIATGPRQLGRGNN